MALARDVHLRATARRGGRRAAAALEGVRVYASDQTHFSIGRALDELGFPPETLAVVPADERLPAPRRSRSPRRSPRDRAAGLVPFAIAAVAGSTNTGSVDAVAELADLAAARAPVAPRRRGVRRGGPALAARRRPRRRTSSGRTRSRSTRTSGSSRRTTSAASGPRRRALAQAFGGRRPEYYRGGERRGHGATASRRCTTTRDQLNFYELGLRGHPALARAEALAVLEARRDAGLRAPRRGERSTSRSTWPRRIAASDDFEALPAEPGCRSSASGICPAAGRGRSAAPPSELDAHQDASSTRSRRRARAGCTRPACAARPTSAPGSSTRRRRRRTSTTCSSVFGELASTV